MSSDSPAAPSDRRGWRGRLGRDGWLLGADLAATLIFAVEGASAAAIAGLDVFGLVVVAFVTALGGGVIRDLILGERPPAAFRSVLYPSLAFGGGALVFVIYQVVSKIPPDVINTLDAAGLALFAVTGAIKALDYGLNDLAAVVLGVTTGCGGGIVRDVLLNHVPTVLHAQIYAVAAAAGAVTTVAIIRFVHRRPLAMAAGFVVCFVLRVLGFAFDWNLPRVQG